MPGATKTTINGSTARLEIESPVPGLEQYFQYTLREVSKDLQIRADAETGNIIYVEGTPEEIREAKDNFINRATSLRNVFNFHRRK